MEPPAPTPRRTSEWPADEAFEAAARWASTAHGTPGAIPRLRAMVGSAEARRGLVATLRVLRGLPVVDLEHGAGPDGTEIARWLGGPARFSLWDRAPVAVLALPSTYAEYLSGRPKQALRTNLTRARSAGLTCVPLTDGDEYRAAVGAVAALRHQDPATMVVRRDDGYPDPLTLVARSADGSPIGLAEVHVDGPTAGLATLVTAPDSVAGPTLRYLVHATVVEHLIALGVSTMVVGGSMLLTAPGTRYFQRRTGFLPVRVRLVRRPDQPSSAVSAGRLAASPG